MIAYLQKETPLNGVAIHIRVSCGWGTIPAQYGFATMVNSMLPTRPGSESLLNNYVPIQVW
jgi:hypothetical protein